MSLYSTLFWIVTAAALYWCGLVHIDSGITAHYFPAAALGDRFHTVRSASVGVPLVVSLAMIGFWIWRRPLSKRLYLIGVFAIGLGVVLSILPKTDNGYEQVYWLDEQKYSIPWAYYPRNGVSRPGGSFFLLRVSGMELAPDHGDVGKFLTVGKAVGSHGNRGWMTPMNACTQGVLNLQCEWENESFVYYLSVENDDAPEDPTVLYQPIEKLLDSFKAAGD
jgi:hypothetical protein